MRQPRNHAAPAEASHHVSVSLSWVSQGIRQRAGTVGASVASVILEHAFGELNFTVVTSVGYRFDNWAVFAGPGIEWAEHEHSDRSATESEFLFRTGIMYEFEAGELIVAPQAIVDFVADEKVVVFGVTLGVGF